MATIPCPHCRKPFAMIDGERLQGHVSYWGEDGPTAIDCPNDDCGVTVYLQEHVKREWSVGRTPDEAGDFLADLYDGRPA